MRRSEPPVAEPAGRQRLDKWLWFARFARTRQLAAKLITEGHVRLNGTHVSTIAHPVRQGDVLTLSLARTVAVMTVTDFAPRRGSATDAARLYRLEDDAPPPQAGVQDAG